MEAFSPTITTILVFSATVRAMFLNLMSFITTLYGIVPQVVSGKYDIRDLLCDLIETLLITTEEEPIKSIDSNQTINPSHLDPEQKPGIASRIIDIMDLQTAHVSFKPCPKTINIAKSESSTKSKSISERLALAYYRYEVTFGVYVLTPEEKWVMNTIVLALLAAVGYALYLVLFMLLNSEVLRAMESLLRLGSTGVLGNRIGETGGGNFSLVDGGGKVGNISSVWERVLYRREL